MKITPKLLSEAERVWMSEAQLKTNSQAKKQFICDYINSKLAAKPPCKWQKEKQALEKGEKVEWMHKDGKEWFNCTKSSFDIYFDDPDFLFRTAERVLSDLQKKLVAEGWTAWHGGEMPVDGETKVQYWMRAYKYGFTDISKRLRWHHIEAPSDIIAYRIAEPEAKPWSLSAHMIENYGRDFANGEKPHRGDFTEEMLKGGWRPLLDGEKCKSGDEVCEFGKGPWKVTETSIDSHIDNSFWNFRTRRPLPTLAKPVPWNSPQDVPGPVCWLKHKGEDVFPTWLIITVCQNGVHISRGAREGLIDWMKLRGYEYSTDRITWKPCTKEVQP